MICTKGPKMLYLRGKKGRPPRSPARQFCLSSAAHEKEKISKKSFRSSWLAMEDEEEQPEVFNLQLALLDPYRFSEYLCV